MDEVIKECKDGYKLNTLQEKKNQIPIFTLFSGFQGRRSKYIKYWVV